MSLCKAYNFTARITTDPVLGWTFFF
jgi:hypothetical protein